MHPSRIFNSVILSLSLTSFALAPTLALEHSQLNASDSILSHYHDRRYQCLSTITMFPISAIDCAVTVNNLLTTGESSKSQDFGYEGSYHGPLSWTSGTCKIVLFFNEVRKARASLMLFAQVAAEITQRCVPQVGGAYNGGSCSWAAGRLDGIVVAVTRASSSTGNVSAS